AATNPDGKVYRIERRANATDVAKPAAEQNHSTSEFSASVYFDPKTKYIWDLVLDAAGNLYVATGDRGEIFRVTPSRNASVFFKSDEAHIRVLALDANGNLIAGSDGSGLVYRLSPDGSPSRLWASRDDLVYALAFDKRGRLLVGTGNRGHIFAIIGEDNYIDLLKASATQVTSFADTGDSGIYASTSNLGKVFLLGAAPEVEGSYESDIFDDRIFSRWGSAECSGAGDVDLLARRGNVDNPDRN